MKQITSFGSLEPLIVKNEIIISEYLTFEKEGRAHNHPIWEICYVTSGSGFIVNGDQKIGVKTGDTIKIPPHTDHWMIPDEIGLEILIVYTQQP